MWIVCFANPRRVVLCSRAQRALPAGSDPAERRLPSPLHRVSPEFTASVMEARAALCLPQAVVADRTRARSSAARWSRTAAAARGRAPSPLRRTNSTGSTPGCGHQVCRLTTKWVFFFKYNFLFYIFPKHSETSFGLWRVD